jgi:hypothetical protein
MSKACTHGQGLTSRHWTDIRNETLFYNKVPYVKRTISTPAKMYKAIARLWVNEAVLHEEGREPSLDFRKRGRAVNLFLKAPTQAPRRQDELPAVIME